jgi:hypothetical protein
MDSSGTRAGHEFDYNARLFLPDSSAFHWLTAFGSQAFARIYRIGREASDDENRPLNALLTGNLDAAQSGSKRSSSYG